MVHSSKLTSYLLYTSSKLNYLLGYLLVRIANINAPWAQDKSYITLEDYITETENFNDTYGGTYKLVTYSAKDQSHWRYCVYNHKNKLIGSMEIGLDTSNSNALKNSSNGLFLTGITVETYSKSYSKRGIGYYLINKAKQLTMSLLAPTLRGYVVNGPRSEYLLSWYKKQGFDIDSCTDMTSITAEITYRVKS